MSVRSRLSRVWPLLVGSIALTAACASGGFGSRVYVRVEPPVGSHESGVIAPGPGFVWIEGYHLWNGGEFVWVPGRWVRPPQPRAVWVPAHWEHDRHGWFMVGGYWK
jgi:hypothetical protein